MFSVGLDVDTRAYFTAATDAISFNKTLSVIAPLLFFQEENIKNYLVRGKINYNLKPVRMIYDE
jgi:hypothetical protein